MVTRRRSNSAPAQNLPKWIESHVCLPTGVTADPGPIKLYPYQRGIAAAIADPAIERISVLKSARIGYTVLLTSSIAHFVVRDPSPVLVLMPTEADCRDFMVSDIEPLFLDSPALAPHLPMPHPGRSDRNTLLHRLFKGGSLKIVAAKAPRNLRRHTARILLIDEVDACLATAEGDPVSLAEKRTLSFANRKIVVGSTPLEEATSHITRLYGQSDQRVWEMPCPSCGAFSEIRWANIEWPAGEPEKAAWRCPHCEDPISERHKPKMLSRGRWRALQPGVTGHAGFRISALASLLPNAAWGKLASEFLRAKDDASTLRVFTNTVLAEPWREAGDELSEYDLASRIEDFNLDNIPGEVTFITAGIDVQDDRLEATLAGHAKDATTYILAHQTLWGSPLDGETWQALEGLLRQRWRHVSGGMLKVDACAIDAGDGGHYDAVVEFCRPRLARKILAIKGAPGFARASIVKAKVKGRTVFIVGVDNIKAGIFSKLARGRSIRFGRGLPSEYFEMLTSERRCVRMSRGRPVLRFERIPGKRAESLDALVYAMAARAALNLGTAAFDQREFELSQPVVEAPPPPVIRSAWMERQRV
jgi:phage terminase large subunit GpA-like protein